MTGDSGARTSQRVEINLGRNVREIRKSMGWSQEELARQMASHGYEMHQTTIAKLENAGRPTTVGELVALSKILHVGVGRLLSSQSKPIEESSGDEKALQELEKAMIEVRETHGKLKELNLRMADLEREHAETRREHHERVERYQTARKAVGPRSPQLPAYIEAGVRSPRSVRAASKLRSTRPVPNSPKDSNGER